MENMILLVDSHHGIYSYFLAYQTLSEEIKVQVNEKLSIEHINILNQNIDVIYGSEFDVEELSYAFDSLCLIPIEKDGETYFVQENEGDIWLVNEKYEFDEF
jgi:hypothetical protein